jgi:hypothetical protein
MSERWSWRLAAAGAVLMGSVTAAGVSPAGAVTPAPAAAPQWSVLPNAVGTAPADSAVAVSCTSASSCLAVTTRGGAVRWNGTAWDNVAPTSLPDGSAFTGVSCATSTFCVATVNTSAMPSVPPSLWRWSGSAWSAMPALTGSVPTTLSAVSCPAVTFCTAVGGTSAGKAIAVTWNGATWVGQALPQTYPNAPYKSVQLSGISCVSSTACVAVGTTTAYLIPFNSPVQWSKPFLSSFDGTSWTLHAAPAGNPQAAFNGVSCWAAQSCAVVGQNFYGSSLLTYADGTWTKAPHPGTTNPGASTVSCADATHCVAAGGIYRWTGTSWTTEPSPTSALTAVSCVAGNWCTIVGGGVAQQGAGTWVERSLPVSQTAIRADLSSVSCATSASCAAVGDQAVATGDGSAWSTSAVTTPPWDVDCPTTAGCYLASPWSGVIQQTASGSRIMPGAPRGIGVLSCASANLCLAVAGPALNAFGTGQLHTPVFRWNGTRWAAVAALKTASGGAVTVHDLSCPTANFCLAVGETTGAPDGTAYPTAPFAATWNGFGWTQRAVPGAAATQSYLSGVDCLAATSCLAVGTSGASGPLIEQWSGSAFTSMTAPAATPRLTGVGCRTATACVAVARLSSTSLLWDGTSWTSAPIAPGPVTGGPTWLDAVSCTPDQCIGVGVDRGDNFGDIQVPLVERLS